MWLGETVQTLALNQREGLNRGGPVLLVCATSAVNNWRKEAGRFTPKLPLLTHYGGARRIYSWMAHLSTVNMIRVFLSHK